MIITGKQAAGDSVLINAEGSYDEPPPGYATLQPDIGAPSLPRQSTTFHCSSKPSNYVSISRTNGTITGEWFLDPALSIPASLLPPSIAGEETKIRKNMFLETMNGVIDANVHIAPCRERADSLTKRAVLHARSYHGSITLKLHNPPSPSFARPVLDVTTSTTSGLTHVYIPRTFRGLLIIKSYNSQVRFSDMLQEQLTTFSEANFTHRCFIGDLTELYESDGGEWQGDQLNVDTQSGGVMVQFDDELPMSEISGDPFGHMGGPHNPLLPFWTARGFPYQRGDRGPFMAHIRGHFSPIRGGGFGSPTNFFRR